MVGCAVVLVVVTGVELVTTGVVLDDVVSRVVAALV